MERDPAEGGQASVHKWKHQGPTWPHVPTHKPTGEDNKVSHSHRQLHPELQQVDNTFIMLFLPTFLIFVALSVSAIPLRPRANGQSPDLTSLIPANLSPARLFDSLPKPNKLLGRFIMGADYASSSGPFLGKSPHKREGPISDTLGSLSANDLGEELPPKLSPGSTPT